MSGNFNFIILITFIHFHPSVFYCLQLRQLGVYTCIFNPPLEFRGFPNLEDIFLKNVHFGGDLGRTVIDLPQLKRLTLEGCVNVNNLNIKAVKLWNFCVTTCPDAMLLPLIDGEQLKVVHIRLLKPIEDVQWVERFNFDTMLSNLSNIVSFAIDGYFRYDANIEDCLNQTLFMLRTVEITSLEGSKPELLFIKLLLDHSPRLENMIIGPTATADAQKMLNIAKDVMLLTRASTKAKIVYMDPQP
ncbi:hypothetical protein L1987_00854 [Smallanthus sonchifolius]|uniref:Uncharacterized protein n=1 Tax=Smallanthus sonchifolius TaxID=185202 RepID=A0ACB9K3E3_9ASTR|nr:hypothetical protein L1987_00854 [Smallanthus sonchifolius]